MRKIGAIIALLAAVLAVAPAAEAQVKLQPAYGGVRMKGPKVVVPPVMAIKPSQALRIALQAAPSAKALGVQLRGPLYIVKLKQGNTIMQVRVNAASGAIQ